MGRVGDYVFVVMTTLKVVLVYDCHDGRLMRCHPPVGQQTYQGVSLLYVELDPKIIVNILGIENNINHLLEPLLSGCRSLLKRFTRSKVNQYVDALATFGALQDQTFSLHFNPLPMVDMFAFDKQELFCTRIIFIQLFMTLDSDKDFYHLISPHYHIYFYFISFNYYSIYHSSPSLSPACVCGKIVRYLENQICQVCPPLFLNSILKIYALICFVFY